MTEAEWLTCDDPRLMLPLLTGGEELAGVQGAPPPRAARTSHRKLRLFACGCCRSVWHLMDESSHRAVEAAERYADGLATSAELEAACDARTHVRGNLASTAAFVCSNDRSYKPPNKAKCMMVSDIREVVPLTTQLALMRCVFGNPFRTAPPLAPESLAWQHGLIPGLARAAYDGHGFDALPALSDALEEAGCTDEAILSHLRSPGPHVRGCWALDLVLGKG